MSRYFSARHPGWFHGESGREKEGKGRRGNGGRNGRDLLKKPMQICFLHACVGLQEDNRIESLVP